MTVRVSNKSGTVKVFVSIDSPGVAPWREAVDPPKTPKPRKLSQASIARVAERKAAKAALIREIHDRAEDAIAYAFDGGDPIDQLGPFLDRNKLTIDDVDRIYKKQYKTTFYGYVADLWSSTQGDQMYDARMGHVDSHSEYYRVEDDGTITPKDNPWRNT